MTIHFTSGFQYKDFVFAWRGPKLYRLPGKRNGKCYGLRQIPVISISEKISGYRIARDKKSKKQVRAMTGPIDVQVNTGQPCG